MKDKKYTFTIPIFKTVVEDMIIEASSLKEAMEKAIDMPSDPENPGMCCDLEVQEELNKEVLEEIEIDNTSDKDLPLLIDRKWSTERVKDMYTERLKGGD